MERAERLREALGDDVILLPPSIPERHRRDWVVVAGPEDQPIALAQPRTTEQVARVLAWCHQHDLAVVPQGGLTGLSGGATPVRDCVLLSLQRLQGVTEVDPAAGCMTVWAGTTLQQVQEQAEQAGWLFPLDIGARGSCSIGGVAATNAGGNRVLRYGMMRDLVLGLEVVLADGTVLNSLNKMQKNNAGFDLKHGFIGSEGCLGVITRLVLKLVPRPSTESTALCAVADYASAVQLLQQAKSTLGPALSAFELMWPAFYTRALDHAARQGKTAAPLPPDYPLYVLIESTGFDPAQDAERFSSVIETGLEQELILDAVLAQSLSEVRALWDLRESGSDFLPALGPRVGFDISVPTGQIGDFLDDCRVKLQAIFPDVQDIAFGHAGDGNLHYLVLTETRPLPVAKIETLVYDCVRAYQGSIAAEHGVGLSKQPFLHYSRTSEEIGLMRTIKAALDPRGIMNPGKVLGRQ